MSKERCVEHTVAWELPNRDSVTKGNYNLADIETKYLSIQTEVVSDSKDHTVDELQQRIAELEEQLKNAIVPKFKIGQEVWYVWNKSQVIPFKCKIENIVYDSSKNYKLKYDSEHYICMQEQHLFATKEEAQEKLEEVRGE